MKKSIFKIGLSSLLLFSSITPIAAKGLDQSVSSMTYSPIAGYTYSLSGDKLNDIKVVISSLKKTGEDITAAEGKVINGKDVWSFASSKFVFDGDVYQSPTTFTKKKDGVTIKREGEIALDAQLELVSGFIEDQFESVQFTGGQKATSPSALKKAFIKQNIGQEKSEPSNVSIQSTEAISEPVPGDLALAPIEDPTYIPAEEDQAFSSTDPQLADEYAEASSTETNIRSTISTSYVYAHLVGPSSLSVRSNYSKYTARAWLKSKYDGTNLTPRYQYSYVNPVDYSSGGGVSVSGVYPKGSESSPISISVAYSAISAGMDFESEAGSESNYTGQSYVRNYDVGFDVNDYYLNYDSGYGGTEGIGANFYTVMMGASTVGSSYKVNWSVKWKIWDRNNKTYFERSGSSYYYVKAAS
jgi:hypothetical protein